ncbi:bacterial surface protein [Lachnospiraceae bacterium KM106-2]|nr:bacterial surface protein [Lachnospiraceae bacterium KM106-2]
MLLSFFAGSSLFAEKQTIKVEAASKVTLNKKKISLCKGEKVQLVLKKAKASKVKWTVKGKAAKVSKKGLIIGKKKGKATVTAVYKKKKYKCSVTVESVRLNKNKENLEMGERVPLELLGTKRKATWSTNNEKVATVWRGELRAKGEGTAVVTAKVGNKKFNCKVTVYRKQFLVENPMPYAVCGCTINSFNVSREMAFNKKYHYVASGLLINTSGYSLDKLIVNYVGYDANGVAVINEKVTLKAFMKPGNQQYAFDDSFYSAYDIARVVIKGVQPTFTDRYESIDVSKVAIPRVGQNVGQISLTEVALTGNHAFHSFELYDTKFKIKYHYDVDKNQSYKLVLKCFNSANQVIYSEKRLITLYRISSKGSEDYSMKNIPIDLARIELSCE